MTAGRSSLSVTLQPACFYVQVGRDDVRSLVRCTGDMKHRFVLITPILLLLVSASTAFECQKVLVKDKKSKRSHYITVCGVVRSMDGITIVGGVPPKAAPSVPSSAAPAATSSGAATSGVRSASGVSALPPATTSVLPAEAGVYLLNGNKLHELAPEIVGWQTGGVLKSMATLGLDRGHVNGKVMRSTSRLRLSLPAEFIIRTLEGTSASEYQLLQLYQKGNRREFRAMTGGVFHASGGAERTAMDFEPEKIAPRTWRIRLERLTPGEYGFLPPGLNTSIASSGKIYSFTVIE